MGRIIISREMWKKTHELEKLYEGYDTTSNKMTKVVLIKGVGSVLYGYLERDVSCDYNELHLKGKQMTAEEIKSIFDIPQIILDRLER